MTKIRRRKGIIRDVQPFDTQDANLCRRYSSSAQHAIHPL